MEEEKDIKKLEDLNFTLSGDEVLSNLVDKIGSSLFLGRYTLLEVKAILAKKNFFKEARRRELWPLEFYLDSSEYPRQRLQIFWEKRHPERLIVDLKINEGRFPLTENRRLDPAFERGTFLHLEWLTCRIRGLISMKKDQLFLVRVGQGWGWAKRSSTSSFILATS